MTLARRFDPRSEHQSQKIASYWWDGDYQIMIYNQYDDRAIIAHCVIKKWTQIFLTYLRSKLYKVDMILSPLEMLLKLNKMFSLLVKMKQQNDSSRNTFHKFYLKCDFSLEWFSFFYEILSTIQRDLPATK